LVASDRFPKIEASVQSGSNRNSLTLDELRIGRKVIEYPHGISDVR
jgi:hypothetical protein